tara:strand:+ start:835 stop:1002 length:168 start_codon:yes stop_codon:yes gene_type:complete
MIKISNLNIRIKEKGLKKDFIISKLKVSKKTFYSRMKTLEFKPEEYSILKSMGLT